MSVVVRMEMPKNCYECRFSVFDDTEDGVWCNALTNQVYGHTERDEDCPILCQLPEGHGDLISRNAVAIACPGQIRIEDGEYWIRLSRVRESIKSAPTIVPAERSEL